MVIELERYLKELTSITSFYRYIEHALQNRQIRTQIEQGEFALAFDTLQEFVTGEIDPSGKVGSHLRLLMETAVNDAIASGLDILRRQILEFCHSTLEKYLCHVVRVYLHTFPEIMMDIEKKVSVQGDQAALLS